MLRSIPSTLRTGTADLPVVPPWMQTWVILFLGPILAWAETRIYRTIQQSYIGYEKESSL